MQKKKPFEKVLTYKDYYGSIEFSLEDNCLFGTLIGIESAVTYEGETLEELKANFETSVEMFIESCRENGIEPKKPFTGSLSVRFDADLYKTLAVKAYEQGITVSAFIRRAVEHELYLNPSY